ncbi:MAG: helix-turn-helix domain-containing protein [Planctomycetota bacterium]
MPKQVDHEAYRRELVDGCIELFAERGYGLTMREAASRLGVSTGTLYHYFPNKQALLNAVVEGVTRVDVAFGETLLGTTTPQERLFAMQRYVAEHEERFAHHVRVVLEVLRVEGSESESMRAIRAASELYVTTVASLLGIDTDTSRQLLALTNGHLYRRLIEGRDDDLERVLAEGHARMLFGRI